MGIELALSVVLFMWAGYWLDGRFGTGPWLLVAGALVGIATGFYGFFSKVIPRGPGGGAK